MRYVEVVREGIPQTMRHAGDLVYDANTLQCAVQSLVDAVFLGHRIRKQPVFE